MKIVTGREFKFPSTDPYASSIRPASSNCEYGSIIKQVVEFQSPDISLATSPSNYFAWPGVLSYQGPTGGTLSPSVPPILLFHYLGASISPQAPLPKPLSIPNGISGVEALPVWTVGNYYASTDVIWAIGGPSDLTTGNTAGLNPTGNYASNMCGVVASISSGSVLGGAGMSASFIFPPVDNKNNLPRLGGGPAGMWDGFSVLNLIIYVVGPSGAGNKLSSGWWRFVHLFSEMTR
jgi:hypothetical protein